MRRPHMKNNPYNDNTNCYAGTFRNRYNRLKT